MDAIFSKDLNGKIKSWNGGAEIMYGYRRDEVIGQHVSILVPLDRLSELDQAVKTVKNHNSVSLPDTFRVHKNGNLINVALSISPIHDKEGKVTGAAVIGRDLTQYKKLLKEVEEQAERLKILFDKAPDAIYLTDSKGVFIDGNETAERVIGYKKEQLIGKNSLELGLVHWEDLVLVKEVLEQQTSETAIGPFNIRVKSRQGVWRTLEVSSFPIREGNKFVFLNIARDITVRKEADLKLKESEEKFRAISESTQSAIILIDNDGKIQHWNSSAERIFQYVKEEAMGQDLHLLLAPERFHSDYKKGFSNFKDTGMGAAINKTLDLIARRKNGEEFPIELSLSSMKIQGRWCAWGIVQDISGRKKNEENLLKSMHYLSSIINNIPDLAWLKDENSTFLLVNDAFGRTCGKRPNEVIGKNDFDFWPAELAEKYREDDAKTIHEKKQLIIEEPIVDSLGVTNWIETIKTPIFNETGHCIGTTGLARDVTARRQAEKEYKKLHRVVEQSADLILITDRDGFIEYVNPKFCTVSGYSREEIIGKKPSILKSGKVPLHEYKRLWETISKGDEWHGTLYNKKKDGSCFWAATMISPIKNEKGEITSYVGIEEDITERKKLEDQLIQAEKMETIGRLASGVAHEVKNPLAIIQLGVDFLKASSSGDAVLDEVVKDMDVAVKRADSVVRELLFIAKPRAMNLEEIRIETIIDQALFFLRHEIIKNHVQVIKTYNSDVPGLLLDRQKMEQVFVNLFLNSIQAMEKSTHPVLRVKTDVVERESKRKIVVMILDEGTGIAPEHREMLFSPFFTTKSVEEGTGMGLHVTKDIIEMHRGTIRLENKEGGGAIAIIEISL